MLVYQVTQPPSPPLFVKAATKWGNLANTQGDSYNLDLRGRGSADILARLSPHIQPGITKAKFYCITKQKIM